MDRKDVVHYIKNLCEADRAKFFYESFGEVTISEGKDPIYYRGHYALAEIGKELKDDNSWSDVSVEFIAVEKGFPMVNEWSADAAICQHGKCVNCKNEYRSYSKQLICPVCKIDGYGT